MTMIQIRILTHGGSSSSGAHKNGTDLAAQAGLAAIEEAGLALEAGVLGAMDVLEDDPRFNAGTGSSIRADGRSIQMDAAYMSFPSGKDAVADFGAVACIERIRHPTRVAFDLSRQGGALLCGEGATGFARGLGHADHDPMTPQARERFKAELRVSDTVGCIATDGQVFAAALSSGGLTGSPLGRIGDVPLPGCGLHAGPKGAVAFTGEGEEILRRNAAIRAYDLLASGTSASKVLEETFGWFGEIEFGCILLGPDSHAAGSNRAMAWSFLETRPQG